MRRLFDQARRLFPLRAGALVLLAVGALLVLLWAPQEADFVLYPAGLVGVLLVAACVLVVIAGTLWLRAQVRGLPAGVPERLETTHATGTGFRFPSLRRSQSG